MIMAKLANSSIIVLISRVIGDLRFLEKTLASVSQVNVDL